jgi:hypothetical protein
VGLRSDKTARATDILVMKSNGMAVKAPLSTMQACSTSATLSLVSINQAIRQWRLTIFSGRGGKHMLHASTVQFEWQNFQMFAR